jgi:hypothetical protein
MSFAARVVRTILAAAAVAACGTDQPSEPVVVRDSAGVRIVENFRPEWPEGQGWEIASQPALILEGALEVTGVAVLGDGTVAVLDAMGHRLHLYGSGGELRASVGEDGEGPGEFRSPAGVRPYRGDSAAVFDPRLGRISVFSSSGGFGRSVPVRLATSRIEFVGTLEDGSFIVRAGGFGPNSGIWREPATFARILADGSAFDTLAVLPGEEFYRTNFQGRSLYGVRPFGREAIGAAGRDVLVVNDGDDCALTVHGPNGETAMLVRLACERRKLASETVTAFERARLSGISIPATRELYTALYAANKVPYPKVVPPYDQLLVDETGDLWAGRYPLPSDSVRYWLVFRTDGRLLGTVTTPVDLEIQQIGAHAVVGIVRDDLGRARVEVHPLVRPIPTQQNELVGAEQTPPL